MAVAEKTVDTATAPTHASRNRAPKKQAHANAMVRPKKVSKLALLLKKCNAIITSTVPETGTTDKTLSPERRQSHAGEARSSLSKLHYQLKLLELQEYSQATDIVSFKDHFLPVVDWLLREQRFCAAEPAIYWSCIRLLLQFSHETVYPRLTEVFILLSVSYSISENGEEVLQLCCEVIRTFNKLHQSHRLLRRLLDALPALQARSDRRYLFVAQPVLNEFYIIGYANAPISTQHKLIRIFVDEIYAVFKPQIQSGNTDPSFLIRFKVLAYWIWCSFTCLSTFQASIPSQQLQTVQDMLIEMKAIVKFVGDSAEMNTKDGQTIYLILLHALQAATTALKMRTEVADDVAITMSQPATGTNSLFVHVATIINEEEGEFVNSERLFWCLESMACLVHDEIELPSHLDENADAVAHAVLKSIFNCRFAFQSNSLAETSFEDASVDDDPAGSSSSESVPCVSRGAFDALFLCRTRNSDADDAGMIAGETTKADRSKKIIRRSVTRLIENYLHAASRDENFRADVETTFATMLFDKRNVKAWCSDSGTSQHRDYTWLYELLITVLPLFSTLPHPLEKIIHRYLIPAATAITSSHLPSLTNGDVLDASRVMDDDDTASNQKDIMPFFCIRLSWCLADLSPQFTNTKSSVSHPSLHALRFLCFALDNKGLRLKLLTNTLNITRKTKQDDRVSLKAACTIIFRALENLRTSGQNEELLTVLKNVQNLIELMKNELFVLEHAASANIDAIVDIIEAYNGCLHVLFRCKLFSAVFVQENRLTSENEVDDAMMDVDDTTLAAVHTSAACSYNDIGQLTELVKRIGSFAGKNKLQSKREAYTVQILLEARKFYDAVCNLDFSVTNLKTSPVVSRTSFLRSCLAKMPQLCRLVTIIQRDFSLLRVGSEKLLSPAFNTTTKQFRICVIVLLHSVVILTKNMLDSLGGQNRSKTGDTNESVNMPEMVQQCCSVTFEACRFLLRFFTLEPNSMPSNYLFDADGDSILRTNAEVSPVLLDYFSRQKSAPSADKTDRRRALLTRLLDEQHAVISECEYRLVQQGSVSNDDGALPLFSSAAFPVLAGNIAPQLGLLMNSIATLSPHVLGEQNLHFYQSVLEGGFVSCVMPLSPGVEDAVRMEVALRFVNAAVPADAAAPSGNNSGSVPPNTMALFIRLHAKLITILCDLTNNTTNLNRGTNLRLVIRISLVMHKLLQCRPRILSQESILQTVDHVGLVSNFLNRVYIAECDAATSRPPIDAVFYDAFVAQIDCLNALLVNNTNFALKCPAPLMKSLALLMMLLLDVSCVYKDYNPAGGRVSIFLGCAQRLQRATRLLAQHTDEFKRIGVHLIADYLLKISQLGSVETLPSDLTLKIPPAAVRGAVRAGLCQLFRIADKRALQNMKLMLPAHLHSQFQSLYDEYTALYKFDGRVQ